MSRLDTLVGASPVAWAARRATRSQLRVIAYHAVVDASAFASQLDLIVRDYVPVTAADVLAWVDGTPLPERALWITFDDGDPSIVRVALPLMQARGIRATALVCPGMLDTNTAHWWTVLERSLEAGLLRVSDLGAVDRAAALRRAKEMPDSQRRALIAALNERLCEFTSIPHRSQLTSEEVGAWIEAGNTIGNHTWDHPCLDRCDESEQVRQVVEAHKALTLLNGEAPQIFAWPNGFPAEASRDALETLGYRLILEFDHRLVRDRSQATSLSRVRLDAHAPTSRARAVLSGAHGMAFRLKTAALPASNRRGQHVDS